jgi:hypothetical protein
MPKRTLRLIYKKRNFDSRVWLKSNAEKFDGAAIYEGDFSSESRHQRARRAPENSSQKFVSRQI